MRAPEWERKNERLRLISFSLNNHGCGGDQEREKGVHEVLDARISRLKECTSKERNPLTETKPFLKAR